MTEKTAWLHVVAYAPFGADVSQVASEIREQARHGARRSRAAPGLELCRSRRGQHPDLDVGRVLRHRRGELDAAGRSTNAGFPASPRWIGKYVPQWIGITEPGLDASATASAARSGSRWPPPPRPGPQPQIGMSPTSTGPSSRHAVEEIGVAGEVDGLRARDDVADRIGGRAERRAAAVVLGRHRADLRVARSRASRHCSISIDRLELPLAQETPETAGHDDRELLPEPLERRQVEMVVVPMGDEDRIDAAQRPAQRPRSPPEVRDAVAQQRIGQQADAVEIDEDRRVPYVLDSRQARNARRSL